MITNPVLPGFHPDPSAIRVGEQYVIATSTFEWFPGIALHTSTDLRQWKPRGHVLHRPGDLDLRGLPDSGGIWAPAISYSDGLYWVVYTIVRTMTGPHKDLDNYLVTASSLQGPWSEPTYLNSAGFDPSLFHAPDGRRYLINVNWDQRLDHFSFGGVLLQEYDHRRRELVGEPATIFTSDTLMEGSHLFWREGYYYLMLAEGGTGYNHGIRLARSLDLHGPYTLDPQPLLTSRDDGTQPIQKAGHGQLLTTPTGEDYVVHLGARPTMGPEGLRSPLGRETFLQRVVWRDGWLRLADGGHHPHSVVAGPSTPPHHRPEPPADEAGFVGPEWQSLREPVTPAWADFSATDGVRLRGRESLDSLFSQSMLARRLPSLACTGEVTLDVDPHHHTELAGLVVYYNTTGYHYLAVTHHGDRGRVIGVLSRHPEGHVEHGWTPLPAGVVRLRFQITGLELQFAYDHGHGWRPSGPPLSLGPLSDEVGPTLRFTGTMIGVAAHDLRRRSLIAHFTDVEVRVDTVPHETKDRSGQLTDGRQTTARTSPTTVQQPIPAGTAQTWPRVAST